MYKPAEEEWERILHGYGDEPEEFESLTPGNRLAGRHVQQYWRFPWRMIFIVSLGVMAPIIAVAFVLYFNGGL